MMPSVDTTGQELDRLICVLGDCPLPRSGAQTADGAFSCRLPAAQTAMRVREAIFAPAETVSVEDAEGRICAAPTVSCPPAIPIAVSGEIITSAHVRLFAHYGIRRVSVVRSR